MPGAPPRFTHETSWIGTIADAFLLFFAPLSCSFAEIEPSRGTWCILIPELEDLETFERFRRDYEVNTINMFAGGPGDAALRYLTEMDLTGIKKISVRTVAKSMSSERSLGIKSNRCAD